MNIIFAGTPLFAQVALKALVEAGHSISCVLTQPDRPAGRGMQLQASPVKQYALAQGLHVKQPLTLKDPSIQAELQALKADVMVVAAYGLLLPQEVLGTPLHGCLNIHASILPRWRGAAPIQRAIEAGDTETGVTIMQMDIGLDTGDMLLCQRTAINDIDTAQTLHDRLASIGAEALLQTLHAIQQGSQQATPQPKDGVSYASKITKDQALINWQRPAHEVLRHIHAFNPAPGAYTYWGGKLLKVWEVALASALCEAPAGTVLQANRQGLIVQCGYGALQINMLQLAGKSRCAANQFAAHHPDLLNAQLKNL